MVTVNVVLTDSVLLPARRSRGARIDTLVGIIRGVTRQMPERAIGSAMRVLLAIVGAAALLGGLAVAATQLRSLGRGSAVLPALPASAVAILVVLGGLHLVRGAVRGRIRVRATKFPVKKS